MSLIGDQWHSLYVESLQQSSRCCQCKQLDATSKCLFDLTSKFEETSRLWSSNLNEMDRIVVGVKNYRSKIKSGRRLDVNDFSITDKFQIHSDRKGLVKTTPRSG